MSEFDGKCNNCYAYMTNLGNGEWVCENCGDECYEYAELPPEAYATPVDEDRPLPWEEGGKRLTNVPPVLYSVPPNEYCRLWLNEFKLPDESDMPYKDYEGGNDLADNGKY